MTIERPMFPPLVPAASPTSRRSILFGLAAAGVAASPAVASSLLPAVTVPAAEIVPSTLPPAAPIAEVDPIFAIIAEHEKAWADCEKLYAVHQKLRRKDDKKGLFDRPEIVVGEYQERHAEMIDVENEDEFHYRLVPTGKMIPVTASFKTDLERLAPKGLSKRKRAAWLREKNELLQQAWDAQSAQRKSNKTSRRWNDALDVLREITSRVTTVYPTTIVGVIAVLAHVGNFAANCDEGAFDSDDAIYFLDNVHDALAKIEGARS